MPKPHQPIRTQEKPTQRPKPASATNETPAFAAALPPGITSFDGQAATLQRLGIPQQRQLMQHINQAHGNDHVQRLVDVLQRQEEETDGPLETAQLGISERELPGHADQGGRFHIQRAPGDGGVVAAAPTTTANVNLQVNAPTIDRSKTMADISAAHGRENVAGWTTPSYAVDVPSLTATTIDINVTLDFNIEVASDIPDVNAVVIEDHEQAHVIIGRRVGQEHLVDNLKAVLEGMPTFAGNQAQIQTHIQTSSTNFETEEAAESQTYDDADYPRMREANFAAGVPLADLEADSEAVRGITGAMNMFSTAAAAFAAGMHIDAGHVESEAHAIMAARAALSETDLARLQYNPEFKALVTDCQQTIDFLAAEHLAGADPANETLQLLQQTLADFTWVATP